MDLLSSCIKFTIRSFLSVGFYYLFTSQYQKHIWTFLFVDSEIFCLLHFLSYASCCYISRPSHLHLLSEMTVCLLEHESTFSVE